MRLGDLDALKEDFDCVGFNDYDDYNRALRIIENAQTVEAFTKEDMAGAYNEGYACGSRENTRPQGEWVIGYTAKHKKAPACKRCNCISIQGKTNFCHNCGAKMQKGSDKE